MLAQLWKRELFTIGGVQTTTASDFHTVEISVGFIKNLETDLLQVLLHHPWAYSQRILYLTIKIVAHPCSLLLYSQESGNENSLHVHQLINNKMGLYSVAKKNEFSGKCIALDIIRTNPDTEGQTMHALPVMWILALNHQICLLKLE